MNNFKHLTIEELIVVHRGIVQVPLGTASLKQAYDHVCEAIKDKGYDVRYVALPARKYQKKKYYEYQYLPTSK
jgi:hypothetical protein